MLTSPLRKNKINLCDYPYEKDIEFRLLMSELSVFEIDVLREIVQGSLKTKIHHLAEYLETDTVSLSPILKKLEKTELFSVEKDIIVVNKEARKYWENQVPKFSDTFRADMEFLRDLLSKVPIHILPTWYSIPRTSDNIFESIIEKYLLTPKTYQRYLDELAFDEPVLTHIIKDIFSAPNFKIQAKTLIEKHNLSRKKFYEHMLSLEFNLVCCLSYNQSGNCWEEVVTPFYEWRKFLCFLRDSFPPAIQEVDQIKRTHPKDFGFVQDLNRVLDVLNTEILELDDQLSLSKSSQEKLFSHLPEDTLKSGYTPLLIKKLTELHLIETKENRLLLKSPAEFWQEKSIQEQAITVYRSNCSQSNTSSASYVDRNLREVEKSLKKMTASAWIYFDDFAKVCTAPIGENEPVSLKKRGKKWKYQTPEYTPQDMKTLFEYIFNTLFYSGIVATGTHLGRPCFSVTPFGRMTLD